MADQNEFPEAGIHMVIPCDNFIYDQILEYYWKLPGQKFKLPSNESIKKKIRKAFHGIVPRIKINKKCHQVDTLTKYKQLYKLSVYNFMCQVGLLENISFIFQDYRQANFQIARQYDYKFTAKYLIMNICQPNKFPHFNEPYFIIILKKDSEYSPKFWDPFDDFYFLLGEYSITENDKRAQEYTHRTTRFHPIDTEESLTKLQSDLANNEIILDSKVMLLTVIYD